MNVLGHAEMFDALSRANMLSPKCKVVYVGGENRRRHGAVQARLEDVDNIAAHISNTYNDPTGNTKIKWIGPGNMGQSGYGTCKAIAALYFSALAKAPVDEDHDRLPGRHGAPTRTPSPVGSSGISYRS